MLPTKICINKREPCTTFWLSVRSVRHYIAWYFQRTYEYKLQRILTQLSTIGQLPNTIKMPDDKNSVPTDIENERPPLSRISYLNLMLHHGYINSAISEYGKLHDSENFSWAERSSPGKFWQHTTLLDDLMNHPCLLPRHAEQPILMLSYCRISWIRHPSRSICGELDSKWPPEPKPRQR